MNKCKYFKHHNSDGLWLKGYCSLNIKNDDNEDKDIIINSKICKFPHNPEKCPYFEINS